MANSMSQVGSTVKQALLEIKQLRAENAKLKSNAVAQQRDDVAVIGMACRFPGADTPEQFWKNQLAGRDCVSITPASRWDWEHYYDEDPDRPGKLYFNRGGYIDSIDGFDAEFFGIAPKEAQYLDPQQRLLLEVTWQALENANVVPASLRGTNVGVFVGISAMDYLVLCAQQTPLAKLSPYGGTGLALSAAAGRISYFLGTHGPAVSIDTACSSSLVALHNAVCSLRRGESSHALVAGVNVLLAIEPCMNFARARMLAPDGKCKTFSDAADGYVRGEGCGALLLKPLTAAERDGDNILAVIRGSAVNQDGAGAGLTVPCGQAQTKVIEAALYDAGLAADDVGYIEAHGTGTALGDPIELKALAAVFGQNGRSLPMPVGSVKTQIGHLEAAAGMAGVIRVIMALRNQMLPSHLYAENPTKKVEWSRLNLRVMGQSEPWQASVPRVAGVSGFGFSGTNAHALLQEYAPQSSPLNGRVSRRQNHQMKEAAVPALIPLSAKSPAALVAMGAQLKALLEEDETISAAELGAALGVRQSDFPCRIWWAAIQRENLIDELSALSTVAQSDLEAQEFNFSTVKTSRDRLVAFMFTGQGSQWAGMGTELYQENVVFKACFDRCAEIFAERSEQSLVELVFNSEAGEQLGKTAITQPALYAFESAMAACLRAAGIKPAIVLGHSVGEYVAAAQAGVFSLEDGMRLVCARGALMQALPAGGGMLVAFTTHTALVDVMQQLSLDIDIAAINAPAQVTLSGALVHLQRLEGALAERGIQCQSLNVSHAFHSRLMLPVLDSFREVCATVAFNKPHCGFISNTTGELMMEEVASAEYWARHMLAPVKFQVGIETLCKSYCDLVVEVGPHTVLSANVKLTVAALNNPDIELPVIASARRKRDGIDVFLHCLGECYGCGLPIDWDNLNRQWLSGESQPRYSRSLRLPNYPFQRQTFWFAESQPRERWDELQSHGNASGSMISGPLGQPLSLAAGNSLDYYQINVSNQHPSFLQDHQIFGEVVFPAAGFLDMLATAACSAQQVGDLLLSNVVIHRSCVLNDEAVVLQTVRHSDRVEIFLRQPHDLKWQLIVQGDYRFIDAEMLAENQPLLDTVEVATDDFYERLDRRGLNYGGMFRTVTRLFMDKAHLASHCHLECRGGTSRSGIGSIDPTMLDGALQSAAILLEAEENEDALFLPIAFDQVLVARTGIGAAFPRSAQCSLRLAEQKGESYSVDLKLSSADDTLVVKITGLRLFKATKSTLLRAIGQRAVSDNLHYCLEWQLLEARQSIKPHELIEGNSNTSSALSDNAGHWLFLDGSAPRVNSLARYLTQHGFALNILSLADIDSDSDAVTISSRIINCLQDLDAGSLRGVLVNPVLSGCAGSIEDIHLKPVFSVLKALQAVFSDSELRLIFLHNRSETADSDNDFLPEVLWRSATAMFRVVAQEQRNWRYATLEYQESDVSCSMLANELRGDLEDHQMRFLHGHREAVRLTPLISQQKSGTSLANLNGATDYRLQLRDYGSFDQLGVLPVEEVSPGAHEVAIKVSAAAVNFKDLLMALGGLTEYLEARGYARAADVPLGFEASGIVTAVGNRVVDFMPGQPVVVSSIGCMASTVTVMQDCVVHKPHSLSFAEAAALPTVFMTALYALQVLADIRAGDKILIHAAAGGVGQAAVQLAQAKGVEIFATASPGKWPWLRGQGIKHIYNSRDTNFAAAVVADTDGGGVDIVLNSLNGDFIPASLSALRKGGHFIEIGKVGVWSDAEMQSERADVFYKQFDLADTIALDPALYLQLQQKMWQSFDKGILSSLPVEVFDVQHAGKAMRHMSQAQHIGKVVLRFPPVYEQAVIRADKSYLVSGATGAIGQQLVGWLVEAGAQELLLMSRSESADLSERVARLREQGVHVQWMRGDVANREYVESCVCSANIAAPLGGVFHAAGLLEDGAFKQLDWRSFSAVLTPKMQGSWHLHKATETLSSVDHFVLFSSMSAIVATPGQSNYVTANAALDGVAALRQQQGLPSLSINWGPWDGDGMAGDMKAHFTRLGLGFLQPSQAFALLEKAMRCPPAGGLLAIMDVDWPTFLKFQKNPLYANIALPAVVESDADAVQRGVLKEELKQFSVVQRRKVLLAYLQAQLAKTLGLRAGQLPDPDTGFFDLGLDSLMGMELTGRVAQALDLKLQFTLLIESANLKELTDSLLLALAAEFDEGQAIQAETAHEKHMKGKAAMLEKLNDAEVVELLNTSLDNFDETVS